MEITNISVLLSASLILNASGGGIGNSAAIAADEQKLTLIDTFARLEARPKKLND